MTWVRYGATATLLWLFVRNAEWYALQDGFRSVGWMWLGTAVGLRLVSLVFASLRWQVLLIPLGRVPLGPIVTVTMMGMAVSTGVSMQAAEVARPYLLSQRHGLDFGATVATLAVEWLLDLVAILALVIPALLWISAPGPLLTTFGVPLLGLIGAAMGLAVAGLVALRWIPTHGGFGRWTTGLRMLEEPRCFGVLAGYSLLVSLCTALSAWLALRAFGVSLSFAAGSVVLGLVSVGGLIPTPGAVGGFHAVCQWGLVTLFNLDRACTVLPVIGLHAVLYVPAGAIGALCLLWRRRVWPRRLVVTGVAALGVTASLSATVPPGAWSGTQPQASLQASDIFTRMVQMNAARAERLQAYDSVRRYTVFEPGHEPDAELIVSMRLVAPATKTFATTSERGVGWIHKRVFRGLINAEIEASAGAEHRQSDIVPANYQAELVGTDRYRGRECYLLSLTPTRRDKYLFKGTAWIDAEDFAIAKLEAEPAKSPSFWVVRAPFVREYQRIDGFWLPLQDETHPKMRFVGEYVLRISYAEYHITSRH